jgi:hypothetical protein
MGPFVLDETGGWAAAELPLVAVDIAAERCRAGPPKLPKVAARRFILRSLGEGGSREAATEASETQPVASPTLRRAATFGSLGDPPHIAGVNIFG